MCHRGLHLSAPTFHQFWHQALQSLLRERPPGRWASPTMWFKAIAPHCYVTCQWVTILWTLDRSKTIAQVSLKNLNHSNLMWFLRNWWWAQLSSYKYSRLWDWTMNGTYWKGTNAEVLKLCAGVNHPGYIHRVTAGILNLKHSDNDYQSCTQLLSICLHITTTNNS